MTVFEVGFKDFFQKVNREFDNEDELAEWRDGFDHARRCEQSEFERLSVMGFFEAVFYKSIYDKYRL